MSVVIPLSNGKAITDSMVSWYGASAGVKHFPLYKDSSLYGVGRLYTIEVVAAEVSEALVIMNEWTNETKDLVMTKLKGYNLEDAYCECSFYDEQTTQWWLITVNDDGSEIVIRPADALVSYGSGSALFETTSMDMFERRVATDDEALQVCAKMMESPHLCAQFSINVDMQIR